MNNYKKLDILNVVDPDKNIIVAYSGGSDSTALLYYCYSQKKKGLINGQLSAIHVNHSCNSESDKWEQHCRNFCENKLIILSVIDNLIKGGSGQAVQNMNIYFNLNENEGLND